MANTLQIIIEAKDAASKELAGVAKAAQQMSNQFRDLGKAVTVIGIAITGTLTAMTVQWAKAGDEVAKLADKTGFSTETLSELRHAAELSDTSLGGLEVGIRRMQSVLIEARDGTANAVKALKELGLSYEQLKDLAPEDQFMTIASALADIEDPTLKAAVAIDIFGRSGTDMLPMLADGADGLKAMRQEAHDLGIVFDEKTAKAAEAFKDSITRLKGAISGIGAQIAKTLAPIITAFLRTITDVIKGITEWAGLHPGLAKAITITAGALGLLLLVSGSFIKLAPFIGAAFHAMLGPIGLITGAVALLATGITVLIGHFRQTEREMADLKAAAKELGDTLVSDLGSATEQAILNVTTMATAQKAAIQSVIDYIKGIETAGMELIPEDVLAKIREIRPDLAADLETIQNGIKDTHAAYQLLTDDITKARIAQIQIEIVKPGLAGAEKAALLSELGTLLSGEAKRLIEKNAPDLVSILSQQQSDIDTALQTQIDSWNAHWQAIADGWDGSVANLRDNIIPAMNAAISEGLLPQEDIDKVTKRMDEILASMEDVEKKAQTITKSPWWASLHPLLGLTSAIETIRQLRQGKVPGFQTGGIVRQPTLAMVGERGPEAVIPLDQLESKGRNIFNNYFNLGILPGDDVTMRRLARVFKQFQDEDTRRSGFGQLSSGYYFGRGGV